MAKYKKRESNTWTLSSTALGWGAAGAVAVVVIAFGIGIYLGYGWGWEEGYVVGEDEAMEAHPDLADQLAEFDPGEADELPLPEEEIPEELLFEEPDEVETPDETETPADEPAPYTEEELGLIEEPPTVTPEEPEEDPDTPEDPAEEPEVAEEPEIEEEPAEDPDELELFYTIQAASSQQQENARRAAEEYRARGHSVQVREAMINDNTWYRVRVGEFPTRRDARQYADQMVEDGELDDYWISQVERE